MNTPDQWKFLSKKRALLRVVMRIFEVYLVWQAFHYKFTYYRQACYPYDGKIYR